MVIIHEKLTKTMNLKTTLKTFADTFKNAKFTDLCPIVSPGSRPGGHPVEAVRQGVPIIKSDGEQIFILAKEGQQLLLRVERLD